MSIETKLLLLAVAAIGYCLVLGVMRVLGAWCDHHLSRHDLIVESKRRRLEYRIALAERDRAHAGGDVIVDAADDAEAKDLDAEPIYAEAA